MSRPTLTELVGAQTLGQLRAESGDTRMSGNNATTGNSVTSCCNTAVQAANKLEVRLNDELSMKCLGRR